jgi:hypothetical protein
MKKNTLLAALLGLLATGISAQKNNLSTGLSDAGISIRRTSEAIRLDGVLTESCWQSAELAAGFRPNFPIDTGFATNVTEARLTFDDQNLYVSLVCYQPQNSYTVQSYRRDFGPGTSDVVNVILSPFDDGLNGFLFAVNPFNVQREALIDNGDNMSFEWDNRWSSAVRNEPDRWVVEMAIPFNTLRYKVSAGQNMWRLQIVRTRLNPWEVSSWGATPRQFNPINLTFARPLVWADAPPKQRTSIAVIPYATGRADVSHNRDTLLRRVGTGTDWGAGVGGDAKIGITPSLNLDLTINPDFSQVEVDRQVTNLSRFELFFPERRQFFLENRDLFATFGFPTTRPFFSRRIGLAYNPVTEQNQPVPIVAGARLSGKLNNDWRIGVLNMHTKRVDWDSTRTLPAANTTVATLQRKVFARSAVSGIFVNKNNLMGGLSESQRGDAQAWNRVAGLEYNLYSQDNRWEGEWYYHRSMSPDARQRGSSFAQFLGYQDRFFNARLGVVHTDSTYSAAVGFVPRPGTQNGYVGGGVAMYPDRWGINTIRLFVDGDLTHSQQPGQTWRFQHTDHELAAGTEISFLNQAVLTTGVFHGFTRLFDDAFDPTNLYREGTSPLPAADYGYWRYWLEYTSSTTYDLQVEWASSIGQLYNGQSLGLNGQVRYRIQPYGLVGLSYSYDYIQLPKPYPTAHLLLLGPSAELAFSRSVFLSGFFQYNTQANNFNINARLQWRFAPVSDLFLVYTDNSYAQPIGGRQVRFLSPKNKSIVLKAVYWLNV